MEEYSPIQVECIAESATPVSYEWTRLHKDLSSDSEIENGILRISRILQTDAGDYQCHARNRVGDDTRILRVYVRPTSRPTPPPYVPYTTPYPTPGPEEVVIEPPNFTGRPGDHVVLTCRNVINVYATLVWTKYGSSELPPHIYVDNGVLTIQQARVEDSGRYICTSEYQHTTPQTQIAEVVIIQTGNQRLPPTIRPFEQIYNIVQGQDFSLICEASGNPHPSVQWSRVHDPLGANVQVNGNILRILNAQINDRGVYLCTAVSDGGTTEESTVIDVERKLFEYLYLSSTLK